MKLSHRSQRGLSLIELLVALTIGTVLLAGAVFVYTQSRKSYGVNETMARLQETARYAIGVIEPDVRMSSYWGLVNDPELITDRALQTDPRSPVVAAIEDAHACGENFAVDLYTTVEATNGGYTFGVGRSADCGPGPDGSWSAQANTDTLTVRRVTSNPTAASNDRLQVYSTRGLGTRLFLDSTAPGVLGLVGQVNDLIVNTYYVAADSDDRPGIPSLRRKSLSVGPAFVDQEVIAGVEDFQVQLGIDPTGTGGITTRYVNPGTAVPNGSQVVAVRLWVLVRSDQPEVGFVDDRSYSLGDRVFTANDGFRRVLLSRTIQIRNSLGDP